MGSHPFMCTEIMKNQQRGFANSFRSFNNLNEDI